MTILNKEIYKKLISLVDKNVVVYPGFARAEPRFPFIVYNDDSSEANATKLGIFSDTVSVSIVICSESFDRTDEITDKVRAGFMNFGHKQIKSCMRKRGSAECYKQGEPLVFQRTLIYEINFSNN
ncbi:hypothetical protein EZS27_015920 [termite gut metagenome]|uniref:DUF3168 domain-containing protein n=1 Tax=termite gut metagenome TaxID=433724 RepID=A0A5J4RSB9_9ZZZZ